MSDELHFRPLNERDKAQLKVAHYELFPIDYEDGFFGKACGEDYGMYSVAAFHLDSENLPTKLVGFAIGRSFLISQICPKDRSKLGIVGPQWDMLYASYILTLGVLKDFQQQGVATQLIKRFEAEAEKRAYLYCWSSQGEIAFHCVLSVGAIHLYQKCDYACAALMHNFYNIRSGRQQDPGKRNWDAFLFFKYIDVDDELLRIFPGSQAPINCLSWALCWPFVNRAWPPPWSMDIDKPLAVTTYTARGSSVSANNSLFYRLFYRRQR